MAVDTKRQEYVDFYFQKVQDKIKDILLKDKKLKQDDVERFNDLIFVQKDYEVRKDIQEYIEETAGAAVDVNIVAKEILNKFYDMVFLNDFNKDTINDLENPLDERNILNFSEFVKESNVKRTYYVPWTSWFDTNAYDVSKMKESISLFLDSDSIWTENQFGWNNQPEVVCFLSNGNLVPKIVEKINKEFGTQWIRANEKNW